MIYIFITAFILLAFIAAAKAYFEFVVPFAQKLKQKHNTYIATHKGHTR